MDALFVFGLLMRNDVSSILGSKVAFDDVTVAQIVRSLVVQIVPFDTNTSDVRQYFVAVNWDISGEWANFHDIKQSGGTFENALRFSSDFWETKTIVQVTTEVLLGSLSVCKTEP